MESLWSAHGVFVECSWSLWSTHGLHEHSDMFGKIYLVGVVASMFCSWLTHFFAAST
jgi:hypothetical protein